MKAFNVNEGVPGFRFAGTLARIKKTTGKDLGLIVGDGPYTAAGAFTKNRVKAAPVVLCKKKLQKGFAQAVLVNSGNANACTGDRGMTDAASCCRSLAAEAGIKEGLVLPSSTGVIGVPLPAEKIIRALPGLVQKASKSGIADFASAIMTTDTFPKIVALEDTVEGKTIKVCGIAKGAGMIMPDMATMLAFIVTDAAVEKRLLAQLVQQKVEETFNRISVDGDMSTNDSVIVLASGKASKPIAGLRSPGYKVFSSLLYEVMHRLSGMIVRDGEGATKLITINVVNARSTGDAKKAALTVANSCLVKTAFFGQDYNWGRIMAALGRSGAYLNMQVVDIYFNGIQGVKNGQGVQKNIEKLKKAITKDTI
ncbi:MAG: bifunctional glutamate N-acetyltransferase/amino-acid acetyltransferase ArgJ, partial [Pseudomonadota bacterium]